MMIRKAISFCLLIIAFLSGCSATNQRPDLTAIAGVPAKIISAVTKPVTEFTVKDAETTLAWVEREEKAGRLSAEQATDARLCPKAVIAFNGLIGSLATEIQIDGSKGVIYYATLKKYGAGGGVDQKVRLAAFMTMAACQHLIPDEVIRAGH